MKVRRSSAVPMTWVQPDRHGRLWPQPLAEFIFGGATRFVLSRLNGGLMSH